MGRYFEIFNKSTEESREFKAIGAFDRNVACKNLGWNPNECTTVELHDNSLVLDTREGWGMEYVMRCEVPRDATIFNFTPNGKVKPVYLLIRDYSGENPTLKAYQRPKSIKTPPESLYSLLFWPEANILFSAKYPGMEKFRQGVIIAIIVMLAVLLWMMASG